MMVRKKFKFEISGGKTCVALCLSWHRYSSTFSILELIFICTATTHHQNASRSEHGQDRGVLQFTHGHRHF